jgi:hypothetical protein
MGAYTVKGQKLSVRFSLLMLISLGLGASVMANWVQPSAQAQSRPIMGNVQQGQYAASADQNAPENIMIILDSSYSMSEPIGGGGGENKMMAAKRTVLEVLRNVPPSTRVGFRIYGNSANQFNSCSATEVLVPLGMNNRHLIAAKMIGVHPTGATPISYSITRSLAEDFNTVRGKRTIILISDGMETCGEDPCDVAVRMQQMGANVKISVVGLGLQDYAANKQLRCVALATKGQFYSANTAAELANSLNKALAVETKVQGTILMPNTATNNTSSPPPVEMQAPKRTYQEKELPAVPIQANKR